MLGSPAIDPSITPNSLCHYDTTAYQDGLAPSDDYAAAHDETPTKKYVPPSRERWLAYKRTLKTFIMPELNSIRAAEIQFDYWHDCKPDYFKSSGSRNARKAEQTLSGGSSWANQLVMTSSDLCRFNLQAHHLGLPKSAANPLTINDPIGLELWFDRIADLFGGSNRYVALEVGYQNHLHAHVLGDRAQLTAPLSTSEHVIIPVDLASDDPNDRNSLPAHVAYLSKSALKWTPKHFALWHHIKQTSPKMPRLKRAYITPAKPVSPES